MESMQIRTRALGKGSFLVALTLAGHGCGGSSGGGLVQATACTGTFTACGGDPTGIWEIQSICSEGDFVAAFNAEMAADFSACGSVFTSAKLAGAGSVTYGGGTVTYDCTTRMAMSLTYTPSCFSAATGGLTASASTCSQNATRMSNEPGGAATCSYAGENCSCDTTLTKVNTTTDSYSVSGSTITEGGGDSYTFCVGGNTMVEREQVSGNAYAVMTLEKR
jgi:hypothetical protein